MLRKTKRDYRKGESLKTTINMDHEMIEAFFEIMASQNEDGFNYNLEQTIKKILLKERDHLRQKTLKIVWK